MPGEDADRRDRWQGWESEQGQTMAEYAIVLVCIMLGAVGAYSLLGGGLLDSLNAAGNLIASL
jgi:Flp pilus assembly pilin Flp